MFSLLKKVFGPPNSTLSSDHDPSSAFEQSEAMRREGNRHLAENRQEEAEKAYRLAVETCSNNTDALIALGFALFRLGRYDQSETTLTSAWQLDGANPDTNYLLGELARRSGKMEDARKYFYAAVAVAPRHVEARKAYCQTLLMLGERGEAQEGLREGILEAPDVAEFPYMLGEIHYQDECYTEAIKYVQQAVDMDGNQVDRLIFLGILKCNSGDHLGSARVLMRAIEIDPINATAHGNLGLAYVGLAQKGLNEYLPLAESSLQKSVAINRCAWALSNLGCVHHLQGRFADAERCYREAGDLDADDVDSRRNLLALLSELGRMSEATAIVRNLLERDPESEHDRTILLSFLTYTPGETLETYSAEARLFGNLLSRNIRPFDTWKTLPLTTVRPLRVGMVSGDLRQHVVSYFLENALRYLDTNLVRLYAYSTHAAEDATTDRLKPYFAGWHVIERVSDENAAQLIRDDRIDLLIDLSGHTKFHRLGIFAWKPAPVQASWLGYWASTGLATIDYLLADPVSVPQELRSGYIEDIWYLPDTRLCFMPPSPAPEVAPLPAMRKRHLTFGSFNQMRKLNDNTLDLWSEILRALPDAILRLQTAELACAETCASLAQRLEGRGVDARRIDFIAGMARFEYLMAYAEVDVILDPFPYTGGTTTCEALWMGVPTMTLAGDTILSRQGASLLGCAGLADWVARDSRTYVERLLAHVGDLEQLARLRAGLREQVRLSPLFDGARFARNLESAFWGMVREKAKSVKQGAGVFES